MHVQSNPSTENESPNSSSLENEFSNTSSLHNRSLNPSSLEEYGSSSPPSIENGSLDPSSLGEYGSSSPSSLENGSLNPLSLENGSLNPSSTEYGSSTCNPSSLHVENRKGQSRDIQDVCSSFYEPDSSSETDDAEAPLLARTTSYQPEPPSPEYEPDVKVLFSLPTNLKVLKSFLILLQFYKL